MACTQAEFVDDVVKGARSLHLAYERSRFLISRWYAEFSVTIPNDATVIAPGITGAEVTNIIVRCSELKADMEADGNAKLNTVLLQMILHANLISVWTQAAKLGVRSQTGKRI